jgi:hypothetical protein
MYIILYHSKYFIEIQGGHMFKKFAKHFDDSMESRIEKLQCLIRYDKEHNKLSMKHSSAFQQLYNRLPGDMRSMLFKLDGLYSDLCTKENKFFFRKGFWEGASIVFLILIFIVLILVTS